MLRWLANGLVVLAAAQALEWCVAYHRMTGGAWRELPMGRHAMTFMTVLAAVLGLQVVHVVLGLVAGSDPAWFRALRVVVFVLVPVVIGWRRRILTQVQRAEDGS